MDTINKITSLDLATMLIIITVIVLLGLFLYYFIGKNLTPLVFKVVLGDNGKPEIILPLECAYKLSKSKHRKDLSVLNDLIQQDPTLTLVLDCYNAIEIKDDCLAFDFHEGPFLTVRNIRVIAPAVKTIENNFLSCLKKLEYIDISSLTSLENVGDGWMFGNVALKEVDLSSFANVQYIGHNFLSGCEALRKINLTSLKHLKYIHLAFLAGTSIEDIDLTACRALEEIGESFGAECKYLKRVSIPATTKMADDLSAHIALIKG